MSSLNDLIVAAGLRPASPETPPHTFSYHDLLAASRAMAPVYEPEPEPEPVKAQTFAEWQARAAEAIEAARQAKR